jgi:hypothetical protein
MAGKNKPYALSSSANIVNVVANREQRKAEKAKKAGDHIREAMLTPNPTSPAKVRLTFLSDLEDARLELRVEEIEFYDGNPRIDENPNFEMIKESIRETRGIQQKLSVTRRPKHQRYMLARGGNTRLRAIQELWRETGDPCFENTSCVYTVYVSEMELLGAHLIENEARGEMSFFDKAAAISRLRREMEEEDERKLTNREFEFRLGKLGLPTSKTVITYYDFANKWLAGFRKSLNTPIVRELQPRFNQIQGVAKKAGIEESAIDLVCKEAIETHAQETDGKTDASAIASAVELAIARAVDMDVDSFKRLAIALEQFPTLSLADLKQTSLNTPRATDSDQSDPDQKNPSADDQTGNEFPQSTTTNSNNSPPKQSASNSDQPQPPQSLIQRQIPAMGVIQKKTLTLPEQYDIKVANLKKSVESFARMSGTAPFYFGASAMPFGYFMELPKDPLGTSDADRDRGFAWWLLATISQQLIREVTLEGINDQIESEWRRLTEGTDTQIGELEMTCDHILGERSDRISVRFLAYGETSVAIEGIKLMQDFQAVVALIEQIRTQTGGEESLFASNGSTDERN